MTYFEWQEEKQRNLLVKESLDHDELAQLRAHIAAHLLRQKESELNKRKVEG